MFISGDVLLDFPSSEVAVIRRKHLLHHTAQRKECNEIENCHEGNTEVSEIPYKGILRKSSDEEHDEGEYLVDGLTRPVIPEDVADIRARIKENADECRERE